MAIPFSKSKDKIELQMATNHYGPFLLTTLLLDRLKASAPSRIINVASKTHRYAEITKTDLNRNESNYNKWSAYRISKLANILFTRELAKRLDGTGVTANSVHPGIVNTPLIRHLNPIMTTLVPVTYLFYKTPKSGAQTSVYAALDPALQQVSGAHFADCSVVGVAAQATDRENIEWLWKKSEEITKQR